MFFYLVKPQENAFLQCRKCLDLDGNFQFLTFQGDEHRSGFPLDGSPCVGTQFAVASDRRPRKQNEIRINFT
jgi:hypothetical protein